MSSALGRAVRSLGAVAPCGLPLASLLALLLAGLGAGLAGCSAGEAGPEPEPSPDRPIPVTQAPVELRSLEEEFLAREATIFPAANPRIATRQDGFVTRYAVEVGDVLHLGDLIAELDPTDLELRLAELRAQLATARATLSEQERSWSRAQELFSRHVISQGERDDRASALDRARAAVDEAKARVGRARQDLRELRITAPIPGVVTEQQSFSGEYLERGDPVATMKRIDIVFALCTVGERWLRQIREGAPVRIEVTSFPGRQFEGLVWKVVPDVDVQSRSSPVKVLIPNPDLALQPGMSARVRFSRRLRKAILVPRDAVVGAPEHPYVWVAREGVAERRDVELGGALGDRWHIRSGLGPDDSVIVTGNETLEPGSPVIPVELPPPGPPTLPPGLGAARGPRAG
ncbi:MAG: efflux RND transporter periplasmic adaptor subunit [Myxococcota bacterium]